LVELLVVIGIIAALIGILLPVLSGVQSRGRDVQCQSNIRQCLQLILAYASENKGQLPFGVYYVKGDDNWADIGNGRLITLWSVISRMSNKRYSGDDIFVSAADPNNPEAPGNTAPFLRCPEAQQAFENICSYAGNFVAFISPGDDVRVCAVPNSPDPWTRLVDRPIRTTQCLPFTALVWDTAVCEGMKNDVGYVTGADIDGQRFWQGATAPQLRYYSQHDPFGQVPPGQYSNNKPVGLNVGSNVWKNIDPPPLANNFGFNTYPYQGNLRYRHSKQTACNVGFADGHVGQFFGRFKSDKTVMSHDALRKNFMVKWPTGIGPDPGLPN
jgi:prepilin-type processing-associated H-X9-DG protein